MKKLLVYFIFVLYIIFACFTIKNTNKCNDDISSNVYFDFSEIDDDNIFYKQL